jgi:hypothetical protein
VTPSKSLTGPQIRVLEKLVDGWTLHQKLIPSLTQKGAMAPLLFMQHPTEKMLLSTRFSTVRLLVSFGYIRSKDPTPHDLEALNNGRSYQCFELVEAL